MMSKQRTFGLSPASWTHRAVYLGDHPLGFIALTPGAWAASMTSRSRETNALPVGQRSSGVVLVSICPPWDWKY